MAPYPDNGSLTTDKRVVDDTTTWDSQIDWEAYQSQNNVEVVNGTVQLAELAIPDSGDLQARYDATELSLSDGSSVSTWADATNNANDLSAGAAPTYTASAINGNPAVRHDGVDDYLQGQFGTTTSAPFHIFAVGTDLNGVSDDQTSFWDGGSNNEARLFGDKDQNGNTWTMYAGTRLQGGSEDTNPHVFSTLFNGASSVLRVDGTELATGDAGSSSLSGFTTGTDAALTQFGNVDLGEILVYPQDKSAVAPDVEQYLADKWGITL